jgi:hypothetical protein
MNANPTRTPASLRAIVDGLEMGSETIHTYLNRETGEVVEITEEDAEFAERDDDDLEDLPKWQRESVAEARQVLDSDQCIALPDSFEIHEYRIMEAFCDAQSGDIRSELLGTIRGSGAFSRFKAAIRRHGIERDWFAYRQGALKDIAIHWLENEDIPFVDDLERPPGKDVQG